jgi:flavin-dependent dehydrogenase
VLLLEKDETPREKVCGEYLCPGAAERLERMGFGPALSRATTRPLLGMRLFSPSGPEIRTTFLKDRPGLSVIRSDLDFLLVEDCGAVVLRGARVTGLEVRPHDVRIRLHDGTVISADVVIGADGRNSVVARRTGLHEHVKGRRRGTVHCYLEDVKDIQPFGEMHLPGDGTYTGLNPGPNGRVNVTHVCDLEEIRHLAARRENTLRVLGSVPTLRDRIAGARIAGGPRFLAPMEVRARAGYSDRVLLAGDAAGFLDPLTGEGMFFAITSGELAGRIAARAAFSGETSAHALRAYDEERLRQVGLKPLLNRSFQWLLEKPRLLGYLGRRLARSRAAANGLIRVIGNLESPRTLLRPGVLLPALLPVA